MTDSKGIYSVAISAQAILDMHSLNNEGGEGNQIQTRMVNIIGADGQLHNVNAISGDTEVGLAKVDLLVAAACERLVADSALEGGCGFIPRAHAGSGRYGSSDGQYNRRDSNHLDDLHVDFFSPSEGCHRVAAGDCSSPLRGNRGQPL